MVGAKRLRYQEELRSLATELALSEERERRNPLQLQIEESAFLNMGLDV